jgi:hypothetical protein
MADFPDFAPGDCPKKPPLIRKSDVAYPKRGVDFSLLPDENRLLNGYTGHNEREVSGPIEQEVENAPESEIAPRNAGRLAA